MIYAAILLAQGVVFMVLQRLLQEDFDSWDEVVVELESRNRVLKVPAENSTVTLHHFNCQLNELFTDAYYWFAKARRNKDAIERFIDNVINNHYKGTNERERKAAGIQRAEKYPAPSIYHEDTINLFELEDRLKWYFQVLESTIKILHAKSDVKVTNNSLLKLDQNLTPQ